MKKLFLAFLLLPVIASAGSVQVYPYITNAHGGTKYACDIKTEIVFNGAVLDSQKCVPTYQLPTTGAYEVRFSPPAGYSYTASDKCSGTLSETDAVQCEVWYADGAPIVETPAPVVVIQPVVSAVQDIAVPTLPVSVVVTSIEASTTPMTYAEQIASLQAQIIELYKILIALLSQKLAVIGK